MAQLEQAGLGRWLELLALSEDAVLARYQPAPEAVEPDVGYRQFTPATRIQTPDGHFYFRDGKLVLLYVSDWALEQGGGRFTRESLLKALGAPAETLQSRVGRANKQYVYPALGVAFSASADAVDFVEFFPPTSLDSYKTQFYGAPPEFRR